MPLFGRRAHACLDLARSRARKLWRDDLQAKDRPIAVNDQLESHRSRARWFFHAQIAIANFRDVRRQIVLDFFGGERFGRGIAAGGGPVVCARCRHPCCQHHTRKCQRSHGILPCNGRATLRFQAVDARPGGQLLNIHQRNREHLRNQSSSGASCDGRIRAIPRNVCTLSRRWCKFRGCATTRGHAWRWRQGGVHSCRPSADRMRYGSQVNGKRDHFGFLDVRVVSTEVI